MNLKEYTRFSESDKPENKGKKVITDDAFAICDFIEQLIKKIEHLRIG